MSYVDVTESPYWSVGDGVTDCTAGIQAAINAAGTRGSVYLPNGTYKTTSKLLISNQNVHLFGDGPHATKILFAPTANGTCLQLDAPSTAVLYQGSVRDVSFWSDDTTYVKTAIEMIDTSAYSIENVVIGGSQLVGGGGYWGDTTFSSKGLYTKGREALAVRNFFCYADKPIVIGPHPNGGTQISADHFNLHNCYLGAAQNPIITVEDGSVVNQLSFTGYQAWVGGYGGLYWVSSAGANGVLLENVRYENATDTSKYAVRIEAPMQGLMVRGGQIGGCNGFYLRNVREATFDTFTYSDTTREAMNATASGMEELNFINCFWQTGSTASISGLSISHSEPKITSMPLPRTGRLHPSANYEEIVENTISAAEVMLSPGAKYVLGGDLQTGFVMITTRDHVSAIYCLRGSLHSTAEVSDPDGFFSPNLGAASFNVGWDLGQSRYVIENGLSASKQLRVMRFGRAQ